MKCTGPKFYNDLHLWLVRVNIGSRDAANGAMEQVLALGAAHACTAVEFLGRRGRLATSHLFIAQVEKAPAARRVHG